MTDNQLLDNMTSTLVDFLVEQTAKEINAVNQQNFEMAQEIKTIIQNTLKHCARTYCLYTDKSPEFWFEHFDNQYKTIHNKLLNR